MTLLPTPTEEKSYPPKNLDKKISVLTNEINQILQTLVTRIMENGNKVLIGK